MEKPIKITDINNCTGCGTCVIKCPTGCISLVENDLGEKYPNVNQEKCILCKKCVTICPANDETKGNIPLKSYVAWNNNKFARETAASGGIATAMYTYCLDKGKAFVGASFDTEWNLYLDIGTNGNDIAKFKGSKYVYSSLEKLLPKLNNTRDVYVVIALPCQIAAIKKVINNENIIFVDLICHGVCSNSYLKQHIQNLTSRFVDFISFRDWKYKTDKFIFSLYQKNKLIYHKGVRSTDVYQIAYHSGLSYRENCYNCKYAQNNRISDITIGDYWGIGRYQQYTGEKKNISMLLVNTNRGKDFVEKLYQGGYINLEERDLQEALQTENQLQRPTKKTELQKKFKEEIIKNNGHFNVSANKVLKKKRLLNVLFPQKFVEIRILLVKKIKRVGVCIRKWVGK